MTEYTDSLTWSCPCGRAVWAHYTYCAQCGRQRPEPKADAPKHEALQEPELPDPA